MDAYANWGDSVRVTRSVPFHTSSYFLTRPHLLFDASFWHILSCPFFDVSLGTPLHSSLHPQKTPFLYTHMSYAHTAHVLICFASCVAALKRRHTPTRRLVSTPWASLAFGFGPPDGHNDFNRGQDCDKLVDIVQRGCIRLGNRGGNILLLQRPGCSECAWCAWPHRSHKPIFHVHGISATQHSYLACSMMRLPSSCLHMHPGAAKTQTPAL